MGFPRATPSRNPSENPCHPSDKKSTTFFLFKHGWDIVCPAITGTGCQIHVAQCRTVYVFCPINVFLSRLILAILEKNVTLLIFCWDAMGRRVLHSNMQTAGWRTNLCLQVGLNIMETITVLIVSCRILQTLKFLSSSRVETL